VSRLAHVHQHPPPPTRCSASATERRLPGTVDFGNLPIPKTFKDFHRQKVGRTRAGRGPQDGLLHLDRGLLGHQQGQAEGASELGTNDRTNTCESARSSKYEIGTESGYRHRRRHRHRSRSSGTVRRRRSLCVHLRPAKGRHRGGSASLPSERVKTCASDVTDQADVDRIVQTAFPSAKDSTFW